MCHRGVFALSSEVEGCCYLVLPDPGLLPLPLPNSLQAVQYVDFLGLIVS